MTQGELTLVASLQVPDESITVFDRAYFSAAFLLKWQQQGKDRHWLMRAKDNLRHEIVASHDPGGYTIRMPVSQQARKLAPELPLWWQARPIDVQLGTHTSLYHRAERRQALPGQTTGSPVLSALGD